MKRFLAATLATALGAAACAQASPATRANTAALTASAAGVMAPGIRHDLLVSTDWLAAHRGDADVVVLHVAADRSAYDQGHIPGARFLPVGALMEGRDGIVNELAPVARLDSVFESVGVSDGSRVILYGPALAAARAFFTLDYLGLGDRAALLDGSLEVWKDEGRPLATQTRSAVKGSLTPRPQPGRVVDAPWIYRHLRNGRVALIDARPQAQFTGVEAGDGVPRPGHIPGAENLFWEETIQSRERPVLKEPEALRAMFREAGADPGDTVVSYCRTGMQASFAYFVSRYLGYETRMYDGSFMDWSRQAALPVER